MALKRLAVLGQCIALAWCLGLQPLTGPAIAQQSQPVPDAVHIAQGQNATVGLITGSPGSTGSPDAQIAADLAHVLDDTDKLRILPMFGNGSIQNIADLIFLKGVDLAIVHTDVLTQNMQNGSIPREGTVQYITRLFPEEIHILARREITSVNDLNGKPVAIGPVGSGTEMTASALLDMCHITPHL